MSFSTLHNPIIHLFNLTPTSSCPNDAKFWRVKEVYYGIIMAFAQSREFKKSKSAKFRLDECFNGDAAGT